MRYLISPQVEMGLTWIDHDTIDKPVEELAAGTVEAKDIEFTVETFKTTSNEREKTRKESMAAACKKVNSKAMGARMRRRHLHCAR